MQLMCEKPDIYTRCVSFIEARDSFNLVIILRATNDVHTQLNFRIIFCHQSLPVVKKCYPC